MFKKLFTRPTVLSRHSEAPLAKERSGYLDQLADQGWCHRVIRQTAAYLLVITDLLCLGDHPDRIISAGQIEEAAKHWATRREKRKNYKPGRNSKRTFISKAICWLEFIGRLERRSDRVSRFEPWLMDFDDYMLKERGLSVATRLSRRWFINRFLTKMVAVGDSLTGITITDIDSCLQSLGKHDGYSRLTLQGVVGCLRPFFRYGATRGWCRKGLAEAIRSPRVYRLASLPTGPSWEDVNRLLALTEGNKRKDIRDRAILMLLAIYGLRAGEVKRLRLEDFDWKAELLSVACTKTRKKRIFPLSRPVGDAVLRYITQVRPRTPYREVFLSLSAPIQPVGDLGPIVRKRLRRLGVVTAHYGPHALRHACATHLLSEGLSLKQIGDHLGHSHPGTTSVYAKVDIAGLRQVADLNLGELL